MNAQIALSESALFQGLFMILGISCLVAFILCCYNSLVASCACEVYDDFDGSKLNGPNYFQQLNKSSFPPSNLQFNFNNLRAMRVGWTAIACSLIDIVI